MNFYINDFHVYSDKYGVHLSADKVDHLASGDAIHGPVHATISTEDAILVGTALIEAARAQSNSKTAAPWEKADA